MTFEIRLLMNEHFSLRDPHQTELGRRILGEGVRLIDELGFEAFTFKKLAAAINSTEASIYRYFENKHKLLLYLVAWYWAWLTYAIDYQIHNLTDPRLRLRVAIEALANASTEDPRTEYINEKDLHRIVVSESSKAFLTKSVDGEREQGLFQGYVNLVDKLADIFREVNRRYLHPKALAVSVIEASRKQLFFAEHIPSVTELSSTDATELADFMENLVLQALRPASRK